MDRHQFGQRLNAVVERYPYQFEGLPYYMLSVDPGWIDPFERLCAAIDAALTSEEKTAFRFRQVKEKFGNFTCYWEGGPTHVSITTPGQVYTIKIGEDSPLSDRIESLIDATAAECSQLCCVCGEQGRLRADRSWWRVLCEVHAALEHA